jgi:ABC-type sugar transport system permease subunit
MAATVPTSSPATKAVVSPLKRREQKWGLIFLAPWIIGFILFFAGPMIASLIFSFTNFVLIRPDEMQFVGLANWKRMFTDTAVRKSLGVTLRFMLISVPISMIVPLCLAVLLNYKHLAFKPLFRTMFYMPFMVPGVAGALIWSGVLNPQSGWVNMLLNKIGITGPDWLNNPVWVIPALTLMGLWGIGNTMVIMLAGLQGVPSELYDASRVDGAGPIRTFFNITLPMISPVIFYNLVLAIIGSFQYFLNAYVLYNSQAGPDDAALFYMLNLYREAFVYYNMGYASTLAWGMFLVALVITVVLFSTSNRWVYYSSGDA